MSEPIKFMQVAEFCEYHRNEFERRENLPVTDADNPYGYDFDKHGYVDIYWGGHRYSIDLNEIKSPRHVCEWLVHLSEKNWKGATFERIGYFVKHVFHRKGWDVYRDGLAPRTTDADEERAKLTPQLRWKVLKRDGYRCRACGAGPENGAVLHIDHILAISNGGETTLVNLQTLCACCNFGKARS